jgi:hypothetical protein
MLLKKLEIKDRKLFDQFLNIRPHGLSVYAFENIYIWRALFDIRSKIIRESLCVFFKDRIGCFAYFTPLSKLNDPQAIAGAFNIMDGINRNRNISRIENVEECDLPFFQKLGLKCAEKPAEFLCSISDMEQLKGDDFKSKRWAANYFVKNYVFQYLPYSSADKKPCLQLYLDWMRNRQVKGFDNIYSAMLEDSHNALKILLRDFRYLRCVGRVVKIEGRIRGFTFGFKLNKETFCVLYEVTDLSVKGLAQFIFRKFCSEFKDLSYVNIMDDSGLKNLKEVKLSYRPIRMTPSYIVQRPDAD